MIRLCRGFCTAVVAIALACCTGAVSAAQFQEVSAGVIPASTGIACGDYDGDGFPDLFVAGYNHPDTPPAHGPLLYHNDQDLSFTDVSASLGLPSDAVDNEGVAWADYDSDGDLDVLSSCDAGTPFLFRQDASEFVRVIPPAGLLGAGPTNGAAWCDYDGDGLLDVFMSTPGQGYLYHNNGDGTLTDLHVAAGIVTSEPGFTAAAAWGDCDNDGWPDLLIARADGPALLFHNNGDGTFADVSSESGVSAAADMYSAAWADYDNDGWLDCYLGTAVYADPPITQDLLFHNGHDGTFAEVSSAAGMGGDVAIGASAAWADYDNDGWLDLYVATWNWTGQAPPFLYRNNGDGTFTNAVIGSGLEGHYSHTGAAWADLDVDGRLDLVQANGNHPARLFHNVGSAGNWLRVQALTSGSGDATGADPVRDAIGARVEVSLDNDDAFPSGRTLTRMIDGGSGHWAQNEQIAHFGLGASALVAVRVRFPDGSVVVHRDVSASQQIVIRDVPADRVEIFDDVPLDYWAYPSIAAALEAGIVQGYWDNTYRPAGQVDRASMAVYLARALAGGDEAVPDPSGDTPSFSDVPADHWAYKYIEYAASPEANVVQGYPGGNYQPDGLVNRGQMAVYIARAMVSPTGDAAVPDPPAADPTFPDVTAENDWSWCHKHVEYLAAEDIVQGYWDGTYRPDQVVTRDQMAVYIQRAFDLPM